jgi:DNA replication protein DnaD
MEVTMSMTKNDYELIASIMKRWRNAGVLTKREQNLLLQVVANMSNEFKARNYLFDTVKFRAACGFPI